MSLIHINNLNYTYENGYLPVFQELHLQLDSQWKTGLIGRNGRGKTTLLRLLSGQLPCNAISANVLFHYFPFEIAHPEWPCLEAAQAAAPDAQAWMLERELELLGLDGAILGQSYQMLSAGEKTKIQLAALFLNENSFLLIDEPTNHLDMQARELVGRYLHDKTGFLLVSHDRAFLDSCIDHVLAIERDGITLEKGNYSSYQYNSDHRVHFELKQNDKLARDIQRLSQAAKIAAGWAGKTEDEKYAGHVDKGYIGHKSAKMMKRARVIEDRRLKAVEEKEKLLRNVERDDPLSLKPLTHPSSRIVELTDVCIRYGQRTVAQDIHLCVRNGDRVALEGRNGAGKSSIIKLILGGLSPAEGRVYHASQCRISYVPQQIAIEEVNLRDVARNQGISESLFMTILIKLGFEREQFDLNIAHYSMGQKKKVMLAASLCQSAHLYLWDEPLNYIDLVSRIQIEQLIEQFKPTMVFVEHDRFFTDRLATHKLSL